MLNRTYHILLASILLAAPLAVGGVHTSVVIGLGLTMVVVWAIQTRLLHEFTGEQVLVSVPSLVFWLLALVCLLQIVPLPSWLVELASPQRWAHFERGWNAVFPDQSVPRAWMPLSLDPAQTVDRGLRWLVLGLTAMIASNHGRLRHAWRDVLRAVAASGVVVLSVGALQEFVGTEKVLFLYAPEASIEPYTTFISPNHAAVFFGLSALCAFALALRSFSRNTLEALLASFVGVILMVAMAEQNSVGATVGFWLAVVALFGFFLQSSHSRRALSDGPARKLGLVLISLPLLAPLATFLAWRFGPRSLTSRLMNSNVGQWIDDEAGVRLELMSAALDAAADYPILGAGAGATERVLSPYLDWSTLPVGVVPTIENEPLEWFFHFGWAIGFVAIVLLSSYLFYALRGQRRGRRLRYGAALAVGLFLAFNVQFHFLFFALGIAIPAVAVLEVALQRDPQHDATAFWSGHIGFGGALARPACRAAIVLAFGAFIWMFYAFDADGELSSRSSAANEELARLVRLVPGDGDIYARAARQAAARGDTEHSVDLATYAVRLEPTAKMHLFLGEVLWKADHTKRALDVYQQVFGPDFPKTPTTWIHKYVVPTLSEPGAIAVALNEGTEAQWRSAAYAIRQQLGVPAEQMFALQLLESHGDVYEIYRLLIRSYLRGQQYALAELWSRLLIERGSEGPAGKARAGYPLLAQALWKQGGRAEARRLIWQAFAVVPANEDLAKFVVWYRTGEPRDAELREVEAMEAVSQGVCTAPDNHALRRWCWIAEGWLAERDGRVEDAEFAFARVERKLGRPQPLAAFYARQGKCVELNGLISRLEDDTDLPQPVIVRLKQTVPTCAQGEIGN